MLRPRADRSLRIGVVVGAIVCAAALAGAAVVASQSGSGPSGATTDLTRQVALTTWEDAVHPLVQSAGQVVALGPRDGIRDFTASHAHDGRLRHMATGWHARLVTLRAQLADVTPPAFLQSAATLLDRAMAGYVESTADLVAAATARGSRRTDLVQAAAASGRSADHLYDQAVAAVAQWRTRLGLPSDWSG